MSPSDPHAHTNKLIHETSPYLLQHAHNPVDWYPWGEEAISRARAEDKPIFLSIGYSACHWCHVMEQESFENERIAEILNRDFISIKVDREERPDLDDLYMQAVQMLTGRGGWPMSVFLTPELKPYFGGTYFPPADGPRGMGFGSIAERLAEAYRIEKAQVAEGAEEITAAIAQQSDFARSESNEGLSIRLIEQAAAALAREFDPIYGGFGGAPKFPPSMALNLLLRGAARTGDLQSLKIVETTLDKMVHGGIFDQLLGGFHRYSTDHHWLVPHFEKMLYDNALLVIPLLDAYLLTRNQSHLTAARRTLDYILRDMTDPEGAFYSTEDADSEGVEGKFYVWQPDEILAILGPEDGTLFCDYYDITPRGNFEGHSILHVIMPVAEFAIRRQMNAADLEARLESSRQKLEAVRQRRIHPGKDDKVVTAWNGMMISAMARAAQVTGDTRYRAAAQNAAKFLLTTMTKPDGTLLRTWRQGKANTIDGFIEDYAHLAVGLIDLYETDFDPAWLASAESLALTMLDRFADLENGGFYTSDGRDPSLLVRRKDFYDGATPSGNSAATHALLRLSILLDRNDLRAHAQKTMNAMHAYLTRLPGAVHHMLCAVAFSLDSVKEIAILGDPADARTQNLLDVVRSRYLPSRAIACVSPDMIDKGFTPQIAFYRNRSQLGGSPTVFVCEKYVCQKPVTSPEELAAQL